VFALIAAAVISGIRREHSISSAAGTKPAKFRQRGIISSVMPGTISIGSAVAQRNRPDHAALFVVEMADLHA
jgi:hypothetical protein